MLKQPIEQDRESEMADWLACDYKDIGFKNAILLSLHTMKLVNLVHVVSSGQVPPTSDAIPKSSPH